jgi:exosortase C (VPDSG-CTERM-specific)
MPKVTKPMRGEMPSAAVSSSTTPPDPASPLTNGLQDETKCPRQGGTVPGMIGATQAERRRWMTFGMFVAASLLAFAYAWLPLAKSALGDELYSYTTLIPAVAGWLIWQTRGEQRHSMAGTTRATGLALALGFASALTALGAAWATSNGLITGPSSILTGPMLAWVLAMWAGAFWVFGSAGVRLHAFPFFFLVFTVPLPEPLVNLIETGLQHGSAALVEVVFSIFRITYLRDERMFWLDGLRFEVAQECSGIRSTLVLFITSLLAGYLLLRSTHRRLIFALSVIPLGLLRNTLRICTITLLSVYVDPLIIHSPLHHRGGPLFFAISLVPLFALLWWFRRQEQRRAPQGPA